MAERDAGGDVAERDELARAALDLDHARALIGRKLDGMDGTIGRVEALLLDARDGSPTWLVVRLGRFGRRTAIPVELTAGGAARRAWAPLARDLVRAAPEVRPGSELSLEAERELSRHFGVPAGTGRHARDDGDRDPGEAGSVPAR